MSSVFSPKCRSCGCYACSPCHHGCSSSYLLLFGNVNGFDSVLISVNPVAVVVDGHHSRCLSIHVSIVFLSQKKQCLVAVEAVEVVAVLGGDGGVGGVGGGRCVGGGRSLGDCDSGDGDITMATSATRTAPARGSSVTSRCSISKATITSVS